MIFPSFSSISAATINHLLASEPWAREKLVAHAGQIAEIDLGVTQLRWSVLPDGTVRDAPSGDAAKVIIRIKPSDLPLILQQPDRAFSYAVIEGDAGFASTISQVAQSVRWEAEEDLSRVVGDVAAVRIVAGAKAAVRNVQSAGQSLTENIAEYLAEEKPVLVRPAALQSMNAEITRLRDDVERLAKRVERLGRGIAR